jgi:hypothetical protein
LKEEVKKMNEYGMLGRLAWRSRFLGRLFAAEPSRLCAMAFPVSANLLFCHKTGFMASILYAFGPKFLSRP